MTDRRADFHISPTSTIHFPFPIFTSTTSSMNRRFLIISLLAVACISRGLAGVAVLPADDPAETIKFLKSKSDLIIVAKITGLIMSSGSAPLDPEMFYPRPYNFSASVEEILFGKHPGKTQLPVNISRIERSNDPLSVKPGKYILFLKHPKNDEEPWTGADVLFGLMPYDAGLTAALGNKLDFNIIDR